MKKVAGALLALMLALSGCTAQDVVITSLEAIQAAATIAIATQPSGTALTVLQVVVQAVPQAIQEYQSTDTAARKATVISGYFAQALVSTKSLNAQDQAILAATLAAVQTLELQLGQVQGQRDFDAGQLSAKDQKRVEKILQDNAKLRGEIAQRLQQ